MKKPINVVAVAGLTALIGIGQPPSVPAASNSKSTKTAVQTPSDGCDVQALKLINQGDWAGAIARLQSLSGGRNDAWLAFAYLYQGKHAELKTLDERVQSQPVDAKDPAAAKLVHFFGLVSAGKLDDAEKLLQELNDNKDLLSVFAQACLALKRGRPADAATLCEKAVELNPGFSWGYRTLGFLQEKSLKNTGAAERAYERAIAVTPEFRDARDLLVDLRLANNDFDGAIAVTNDAIKKFPKDPVNYWRLSQIYTQQWRLIEALAELQKSTAMDKNDARFYRARATILRHQGKTAEAIAEQKKAVELGKDKSFELVELAALQESAGDAAGAIASLDEAIKTSPDAPQAHQKLVALLRREKKYVEMAAEYKRVVDKDPKNVSARLGLAEALMKMSKLDESLEQLKEAANLEPSNPRPHRESAKIELSRKNYAAAARAFTRALNVNPGSVEDLVALGYCYFNNDDYMQAETAFVTGLALQQLSLTTGSGAPVNTSDIMRSLAAVLLTEGRYREAVVNMDAVVLNDKDPQLKLQDSFMLAQCKALRDRNAESVKELCDSFAAMSAEDQSLNRFALVDTLSLLGKRDLVAAELAKAPSADLQKDYPVLFVKLLRLTGKPAEAEKTAQETIDGGKQEKDAQVELWREIATIRKDKGDLAGAQEALNKAVAVNAKSFNAFIDQGRIHLAQKSYDYALGAATRALEANPYSVDAYMLQADTDLQAGKLTDAMNNYLKAAELYPTLVDAHRGLKTVYERQSKAADAKREAEIVSNLEKNG